MARSLIAKATESESTGLIIIGNNDGTGWCECENCRRLDPPEEAARNRVATRYWTLVQTLAQRVWEVKPDAKLGGWAYQNFWAPPIGIELDPRLIVCVSFNNQCWRHAIADPNCSVNSEFRKLYLQWKGAWKTSPVPTAWTADSDAIGSTRLHPDSTDNYFVELEKGILGNWYVAPASKLRITFRASGHGKARLWTGKYEKAKGKGYPFKGSTGTVDFEVQGDTWQTYSLEVDKASEPRLYVRFFHQEGIVRIDDVVVTPVAE